MIGGVISSVVVILGSKYIGRATAASIDTYMRFIGTIFVVSLALSGLLAFAFSVAADGIFGIYTTDQAMLQVCKSITPLVVFQIALGTATSVVGGMVYAAQEFAWLTSINIFTQYAVYLPLIVLVENKHFGEVTLVRLMLPGLAESVVGTVAQVSLIWWKVWPELQEIRAQSIAIGGGQVQGWDAKDKKTANEKVTRKVLGVRTSNGFSPHRYDDGEGGAYSGRHSLNQNLLANYPEQPAAGSGFTVNGEL